jgi:hypothetical protein
LGVFWKVVDAFAEFVQYIVGGVGAHE